MASASPMNDASSPKSATYDADEVTTILGIAKPTVYERARIEPERFGVVRFGRAVRFRRVAIDRIAYGDER